MRGNGCGNEFMRKLYVVPLVGTNVRFGSKADMCSAQGDVRYVPKADLLHFDIRLPDHAAPKLNFIIDA